jgi:glycosyltransferase involved in cell wall biosynthesis
LQERKKVLIVAYLFPPIGGIGVQRPLKFVRYLHELGWHPTVLTTEATYSATMDPSLLQEVPQDVEVVRVKDPIASLMGKLIAPKTFAATSSPSASGADRKAKGESNSGNGGAENAPQSGLKSRIKDVLKKVKAALFIPDENILWALRAGWQGRKLVKQHNIEYLYTTSGPHSTQIAGWLIRRLTGVKWVADFRDPWIDNLHYEHAGARKAFERSLERRVFRDASAVITVTDGFKALFDRTYPEYGHKVHVIRNGVDPSDFPKVVDANEARNQVEPAPFTMFYAGILYPKRSPASFLVALDEVIRNGRIAASDIRVEFAGVFDYPGHSENRDLVDKLQLWPVVDVLGYMSRSKVLERMQTVDALLLIGENVPESKMYVPGKLYEYLFAKKPILAIMEEGEAARLIRESNAGVVLGSSDIASIGDAIVEMVNAHKRGEAAFTPNPDEIWRYTRQSQAEQLSTLFDSLN